MYKLKKIIAALCVAALLLSCAACGQKSDYAGKTIVGQVTEINNNKVTLQLGTWEEDTTKEPPEKPGQDSDSAPAENTGKKTEESASQENTASKASGNDSQQPPEPPEKPEEDNTNAESSPKSEDNEAPEQDKNTPKDDSTEKGTPPDRNGEKPSSFTAGEETATVDLSNISITKNNETISVADISTGDILELTFDDNGNITEAKLSGGKEPGNSDHNNIDQGTSANTIDSDTTLTEGTYDSTGDDENALRITNATATLSNITVDKSAGNSSSPENGDFYGINAAILATDGATATIQNATIRSSAQNGNGVFSYGDGTTVNISDSTITTTADNSGGIQTTGGGTTIAKNLTVSTAGNSSAAIRSDRGGGTVKVSDGTYTSSGLNSPAVYSTAKISISKATLTAENSEALVIEGSNSIALKDCTVSGNMSDEGASADENMHNVMIYQSMSGDAEVGTASFTMKNGTLTGNVGDLFYITNTACKLSLSNVDIQQKDKDGALLRICGNSTKRGWGTAGKNGAQVTFTASNQTLEGDIIVDTISTLDMTLKDNSTFTGTISIETNEDGDAVENNADITIEKGSTWNLTGDCTLSTLTNNGTINFNGHTITLADGTVLK